MEKKLEILGKYGALSTEQNQAERIMLAMEEYAIFKSNESISKENEIKNIPSIEIIESEIEKRWGQPTSKSYIARHTRNEVAKYLYQFIVNLKR